jgi:hypothetical protein
VLLAGSAARHFETRNPYFSRFCTDPVLALLWQHAINSPRECSDSLISLMNLGDQESIFGWNVTSCALRSILPAYVSLCDASAIRCEETMLAVPAADIEACEAVYEANGACSAQCAALRERVAEGNKCFESVWSVQEAIAHAANQTCADSGEWARHQLVEPIAALPGIARSPSHPAVAFVKRSSKRSEWHYRAETLNSKCSGLYNSSTLLSSELPDAQGILDSAWGMSRLPANAAGFPRA